MCVHKKSEHIWNVHPGRRLRSTKSTAASQGLNPKLRNIPCIVPLLCHDGEAELIPTFQQHSHPWNWKLQTQLHPSHLHGTQHRAEGCKVRAKDTHEFLQQPSTGCFHQLQHALFIPFNSEKAVSSHRKSFIKFHTTNTATVETILRKMRQTSSLKINRSYHLLPSYVSLH